MRLTVVLLTYTPKLAHPRASYAKTTLKSTLDNLRFSSEIAVHIADDGSPQKHRDTLREIAAGYSHVHSVGVTNAERRGYGASFNLATQAVHPGTDIVLPLEDDWQLTAELNIDPYVAAMQQGVGCIRLGYIGFTQPLRALFRNIAGETYLQLDPESSEPHVWAGHPRLETVAYQRATGPWPEGLDAGSTEFVVAQRPTARMSVFWPFNYRQQFAHIGTVQAREDQQ